MRCITTGEARSKSITFTIKRLATSRPHEFLSEGTFPEISVMAR